MKKHIIRLTTLLLQASIFLSGCGDPTTAYENLVGMDNGTLTSMYMSGAVSYLESVALVAYLYLRDTAAFIAILSFVIGLILNIFAKKTKRITRVAVFTFMVLVPVTLFLAFFALAKFLNHIYVLRS